MGRKERFAVLGKVSLICFQHLVEPRQELLGAVIRVQHDWNTVVFGHGTDVKSASNGSDSGRVGVAAGLTSIEFASSVGNLNHDGRVADLGSFQDGIASGRTTLCVSRVTINNEKPVAGILSTSNFLTHVVQLKAGMA
jgi:hypothetical protein